MTDPPRKFNRYIDPAAWRAIDWGRRNAEIARELGVHRSAVTLARARYAPGTEADTPQRRLADFLKAHPAELRGLTAAEIVRRSGCGLDPHACRHVLERAGVKPAPERGPRPSKWAGLDWRLPVTDLARIWGQPVQKMNDLRRHLDAPRARWRKKPRGTLTDPEYPAAVKAEESRVKSAGVEAARRTR